MIYGRLFCFSALRVSFLALLFLFSGTITAFSQGKWTRIEHKKEISFELPEGFLYNEESFSSSTIRSLLGFRDGVSMDISLSNQLYAERNLERIILYESRKPYVVKLDFKGGSGKIVTYTDRGYEQSIYLASDNGYYVLSVKARSKDDSLVSRFINSINFKGNPMFQSSVPISEPEAETVSTKTLKPSPAVEEARKKKFDIDEKTITFRPLASFVPCDDNFSIRPVFFVTRPAPKFGQISRPDSESGEVRLNARFLADGRVGDIVAYSDLDRSIAKVFAIALKQSRFVPAERDGTPVDSCDTVRNVFAVSTRMTVVTLK